jgi:3-hydroxyacyl-[acyl-carrier-protein] dehydratase|tara:strand:+ start:11 stop:475 length:465 start_codon:yes stop_codon:yes gene_type:complete
MGELQKKTHFEIQDIVKILPHRYPFILIDRIDKIIPGKSLTAIKNVTVNEPFFQGHFPSQPVMPGVLTLESMSQAGAFLVLSYVEDPLKKNMFFSGADNVRFRKPIVPGNQLYIHMNLVKQKLNICKFDGKCYVDNNLVAEAKLTANIVDRAGN